MRKFLKKIGLFVGCLMLIPLCLLAYNVHYDPFGVVHGDMKNQFTEPNLRYLKVKHLVNHPQKYDSYIMGSSRAGKIDPRNISAPGKWYNLAYSEGLPLEHLEDLQKLVENNVQINKLVIGLDNITYLIDPYRHLNQVPRKRYENWHTPYFEFVFLKPDINLKATIAKQREAPENPFYDVYGTGMPQSSYKDRWATNNPEKYRANKRFDEPTWAFYYEPRIEAVLNEIEALIQFCHANNIEISFFINPMHKSTYLNQDMDTWFAFIKGLSERTSYYDFSGLNTITTDNFYYYETSHFRNIIGDQMMDAMLENKEGVFGQWVTKENIDQVILAKKSEIMDFKKNTLKTVEQAKKDD